VSQLIGWISSLILVATISNQVWRQWKRESSAKSARWLFWGQLAASTGFCLYSWLKRDWVFLVTNAVMLLSAIAGAVIMRLQQQRAEAAGRDPDAPAQAAPRPR
jgi:uncharacterized protein with PQ loop repeat